MIKLILIIGLGGFLGTISRYLTTVYIHKFLPVAFPYGTFLVNVSGCFLAGLFYGLSVKGNLISPEWRMFLTVGFCGGFTTFSAFANENINFLQQSQFNYFLLYTGLSIFLGLTATYLGHMLTRI